MSSIFTRFDSRTAFFTMAVLVLGLFTLPAMAVSEPYAVSGVRVDAKAESASAAREVAMKDGYRNALEKLMRRNTLRQHWGNLPSVSDADVPSYVQSFSVANEKTSRTRYLAELTVVFKASAVRNLLRGAGVPFSETVSKPILVLPVWQVRDRYVLWGDPNPWRDAWAHAVKQQHGLLPITIPQGDLPDLQAIDGVAAANGNDAAMAVIAQRYGVEKVAVSHGRLLVDRETDQSYAQIVTRIYSSAGEVEITDQQFVPEGSKKSFFRKLAASALGDMNEDWKSKTLVRFGQSGQLQAVVEINSLAQWVAIRKAIEEVSAVQGLDVGSLSVSQAYVTVSYRGGVEQLAFSLNERNLELAPGGNGYVIRPRRR